MKKTVMLFGGLLLGAMISSASTVQIFGICDTTGGTATGASASFAPVSVVCGNFANANGGTQLGAGYTLLDAFVVFQNGYSLGANGSATATFTWSSINANLAPPASYTDVVTGGITAQTYTPSVTSAYDPLTSAGSCTTNILGPTVSGGCASTPSAFLGVSSTFSAASVTGSASNLQSNGNIGVAAYIFYDYSTPATGAPEPGTLALAGASLVALGVFGRKKIRS